MLKIKNQIFNALMISMLVAAPVLAAEAAGAGTAASIPGKLVAAKKLDCEGGACQAKHKMGMFSDSQLEKISSAKSQFMDKTGAEFAELGSLHRQLRDVLSQTTIDKSKAESIQTKINSIRADIANARLALKLDEIAALTPEQREQFHHRMLLSEAFGGFRHHMHFAGRHPHQGTKQDRA